MQYFFYKMGKCDIILKFKKWLGIVKCLDIKPLISRVSAKFIFPVYLSANMAGCHLFKVSKLRAVWVS